jgi:hypothetical protein
METKVKSPRKIFEILIRDKPYDVYDIDGKEHEGHNGEPKTWWLYHGDRLPEGLIPPIDSENWEPWHSSIQRHCWDIRFKQTNSTKEKWNETHFRSHTHVEMWCNGKLFYSFGTTGSDRGMSFAMAKVQYLQTMLSEHCFNFYDPQSENGRKIYWYGLPATVKVWRTSEPWEIGIIPDYTAGLDKQSWWKEYKKRKTNVGQQQEDWEIEKEEDNHDEKEDFINWGDASHDQHINWFRK